MPLPRSAPQPRDLASRPNPNPLSLCPGKGGGGAVAALGHQRETSRSHQDSVNKNSPLAPFTGVSPCIGHTIIFHTTVRHLASCLTGF